MPLSADEKQIVDDAVARNTGATVGLPSASIVRPFASRFLGADVDGIWIESSVEERAAIDALIAEAAPITLWFRYRDKRVNLHVRLKRRNEAYPLAAGGSIEALQIELPGAMEIVQRRTSYRVPVPMDFDLQIKVWRIQEKVSLNEKPMPSTELIAKLHDISSGGIGVTLKGRGNDPLVAANDQRLRVTMKDAKNELLIEGRLRGATKDGAIPGFRYGIKFKKMETSLEGRRVMQAITKIIGALQREELRRNRFGSRAA